MEKYVCNTEAVITEVYLIGINVESLIDISKTELYSPKRYGKCGVSNIIQ